MFELNRLQSLKKQNKTMFELNRLQSFDFDKFNSLQLIINEIDRENVWHQAQHHSNPISRYNAYLNGVCLKTFLNWLSEWFAEEALPQPSVWHGENLASIWEVVNGTAFQIGETRLVLIPCDEEELEEFCVPQEWVDIPNWSADYYLPVQVNLDGDDGECWIELSGFATHRQLKNDGRYNTGDRTYCLAIEELTASLTVMQITFGLNLQQESAPLPSLSDLKVNELLHTLGNLSVYSPRLIVPFAEWAAFLANDECRQLLYDRRLEITQEPAVAAAAPSAVVKSQANLIQRAKTYLQAGWETIDEIIEKLGILDSSLIGTMEGEGYRYRGLSNEKRIPTLVELLQDHRHKSNQLRAAKLLACVEVGNQEAIAALNNLLQTTQNDIVQRQAAVSLGKLDPNNSAAAAPSAVVQNQANLIQRAKTYLQAGWETIDEIIEKLGILDSGLIGAMEGEGYHYRSSSNQNGIPTLVELLQDHRHKSNQLRAAELLGCVGVGNQEAIAALNNLLQTTQNDIVQRQAAVSLGKLDPDNSAAGVRIGKIMELTIQLNTVRVVLEITLLPKGSDKTNIELRVLPVPSKTSKNLPPNLELIILDEEGKVFWKGKAQNSMKNIPNYEFMAAVGDYFQVKVACDGISVTEDFTI